MADAVIRGFDIATGNPIRDSIYITSRIRFDAAKRLRLLSVYSTTSLTLLSCYLIVLNIFQIVFRSYITDIGGDIINTSNIAISILMIVVGLVEYSTGKDVRARDLEHNARELSALHGKVSALAGTGQLTEQKYEELSAEYNNILDRCPVAHNDHDYKIYRAMNPNLFAAEKRGYFLRALDAVWLRTNVYGFYYCVALFLPIAACLTMLHERNILFRLGG